MNKEEKIREKFKDKIIEIDLVNVAKSFDKSKNKKYLETLVRLNIGMLDDFNRCIVDEIQNLYINLLKFDELATNGLIDNADLNTYGHRSDIYEAIENANLTKSIGKAKKEVKKLYDDDNYTLFLPLSYDAAAVYGKGTRWCITQKNYFYRYIDKGILGYFIDKRNNRKLAIYYDYGESFYFKNIHKSHSKTTDIELSFKSKSNPTSFDEEMHRIYKFSNKFSCWTDWDDKIDLLFAPIPYDIKQLFIEFCENNNQTAQFINEDEINNLTDYINKEYGLDMPEPEQQAGIVRRFEYVDTPLETENDGGAMVNNAGAIVNNLTRNVERVLNNNLMGEIDNGG